MAALRAEVATLQSTDNNKKAEQLRDIVLAVAFTAGPFGFGVPIFYSCIAWAVAWFAFVHLIWNLEQFSGVDIRVKSVVGLMVSAALVVIVYPPIRAAYIREKAKATSGDLVAVDDGKEHSSDPPMLQIGPTGGTKLSWNGPRDSPMFSVNSAFIDKIALKMIKGRAYLSTTVRDQNHNLIVEITDNHWTVSSSTAVCWDKNYTRDSLEVKDGHGRVVLQVRVMPSIVQLQAEWAQNPGTPYPGAIVEDGKYEQKTGIKPLLKYPSELYWGELEPGPY